MDISRERIYFLLQRCKDLAGARHLHAHMLTSGLCSISVLADHLIRIFTSCQSLLEANLVFCGTLHPTVFTWNSMIAAHTSLGQSKVAIRLYFQKQEAGIRPDKYIYTGVLRACADTGVLDLGIYIHNLVVEYGLESDVVVGSSLILLYFKCGAAYDAIRIFSKLTSRNTISWNTVISYCNEHGYSDVALVLYEEMQQHGIKPEASTYSSIFKACGSIGALESLSI
ncbi:hypothetical protein KP509_10G064700 [Ceratopteris richardii]|uniref:Pentatricopeptide repeat-containing protein n=1 Tax=Ceratopteris richardii TaxID=49495 RepID=A0A8T2U035_CERRI|nr:hypothetical protein KP509_10G064700 [Ceratopteris richardii]